MATSKIEVAAQIFEHLCEHDYHGYSQPNRYGDGEGVCEIEIDGKTYEVEQGDRDCSSAICDALRTAGIPIGSASTTRDMKPQFLATGDWEWHDMDYTAHRGDVYLAVGYHTAMCLGDDPDILGEFSISETGGIDGETGDQTGKESSIHSYYDYPWDGILHYVGEEEEEEEDEPIIPLRMKQKSVNGLMTYFCAWVRKGTLTFEIYTQKSKKWMKYKGGATLKGDGSPIMKIRMSYTSPENTQAVYYRVVSYTQDKFYAIMKNHVDTSGGSDDFAGDDSNPIVCIQAYNGRK